MASVDHGTRSRAVRWARWLRDTLIVLGVVGALLGVLELTLAVVGVKPVTVEEDPFVGFTSWEPLFVPSATIDGKKTYVTARNKLDLFNRQEFLADKPDGTFRVFCVGGSTTYGRPFDDATSFCGWLRAMLPEADPTRTWEVINTGGISYASYRVARLMEELAAYQPDLFIVYTGHNEFLEERTYHDIAQMPEPLRDVAAAASRTRLYTMARAVHTWLAPRPAAGGKNAKDMLPGEVRAILNDSVGPEAYHRDDALSRHVLDHLRINIRRMVEIARGAGADIIFVTPASNIRDFSPFKSQHDAGLDGETRRESDAYFDEATRALESGNVDVALERFDESVALDPRFADTQYWRGRTLWSLGRFDDAREAFLRARDEDVCPLRALSSIINIVSEEAIANGAGVVDFVSLIDHVSPHGLPGNDHFLDHVHPTVKAHGLLAEALLRAMADRGLVSLDTPWDGSITARVGAAIEEQIDDDAHAGALCNLAKVLGWAGKFDEAYALTRDALELAPDNPEVAYGAAVAAENSGRDADVVGLLRKTLLYNPDHAGALLRLGNAMSALGESDKAMACFQRLSRLDSDLAYMGYNNLANELAAQGQPEEAIERYRSALALRPDYVPAMGNLGLALAAVGRNDEAATAYRNALALDPDNGPIHFNLGVLLLKRGEVDGAVSQLERAVELLPSQPSGHFHLARALEQQGHFREAVEHLRRAMTLRPRYPAARRAWARIAAAHPELDKPPAATQ